MYLIINFILFLLVELIGYLWHRFVNHLGQAEFIKATTDVSRFVINTSIGIFGICSDDCGI